MKNNKKRQKVIASIACLCGAGAITFATVGGYQINEINKLDTKMKDILRDTKLTSSYGEYIDSKRQAIDSAYASGVITLKEHGRKIENLTSDKHLIEVKDQFMTEENIEDYNKANDEYLRRGIVIAGCLIGGVTTGTLTMSSLCSYIDEKNKNKSTKNFDKEEELQNEI